MVNDADNKVSVLFVCLGNICRSPMAEGAFRNAAGKAGLNCIVDSAGTAAYHLGEAPDPRAFTAARKNGVDLSGALGRQIATHDFDRFDHIIAMDTANIAGIKARAPKDALKKVSLLMDAVPGRKGEAVEDPYYGDETNFAEAWDQIDMACRHLVEKLKPESH